jgi:transcription initiation factor TFIID subunit 6
MSDVVNGDLQLYFVRIINLLRDDVVFSKDKAIGYVAKDLGLHQLLPYFLQFIFGQITLHFQEHGLIDTLIGLALALVTNESMGSELYVHSFLKIAFAVLVGVGMQTPLCDDDKMLREHAAELLGVIVKKYRREYPTIHQAVFSSLVRFLFEAETSLAAHYGALLGIRELGEWAVLALMPHLKVYYRAIAEEIEVEDGKQFSEVAAIAGLLHRIAEEVTEGCTDAILTIEAGRLCECIGGRT